MYKLASTLLLFSPWLGLTCVVVVWWVCVCRCMNFPVQLLAIFARGPVDAAISTTRTCVTVCGLGASVAMPGPCGLAPPPLLPLSHLRLARSTLDP